MKVFQNIDELKTEVVEQVTSKGFQLLSIDGKDGCGKSTLADFLSKDTGFIHINLDEDKYLKKNQGKYIDFIKYDILQDDLISLLKNDEIIIVDGICVLNIIDKINLNPEFKIYVKKLLSHDNWYDGRNFNYSISVNEIINEKEKTLKNFIKMESKLEGKSYEKYKYQESICHEIIRYHHEYKPDLNAHVIYERLQNAG